MLYFLIKTNILIYRKDKDMTYIIIISSIVILRTAFKKITIKIKIKIKK